MKIRSWLANNPYLNSFKIIRNIVILLIGAPIFIYGFVFNAIPFFTIDTLVRKKIKDVAFWSTFSLVAGIVLFPIVYLLELIAVSWLISGVWLKLAFIVSLPFSGKISFMWYILLRKTIGRFRLYRAKMFNKKQYYALFKQKEAFFNKLDDLIPAETKG